MPTIAVRLARAVRIPSVIFLLTLLAACGSGAAAPSSASPASSADSASSSLLASSKPAAAAAGGVASGAASAAAVGSTAGASASGAAGTGSTVGGSAAAAGASGSAPGASAAGAAKPSASAAAAPTTITRSGNAKDVILATTTSTQDSGLLDVLVPMFEKQGGWNVKTVAVGTGAALALGAGGQADVVLVHAPQSEIQWMNQGYGTERLLVMHNDFVILGPRSDPDGIKGAPIADAFKKIAAGRTPFVSRDDNSGTDQFEKGVWQQVGINPKGQAWYLSSGQGMGATLTLADQKGAYTLSDRATYLSRKSSLQSVILVEKQPQLLNVYHVMPVNPAKFPGVKINAAGAKAFADFMVAPDTQKVIGQFGIDKYGQQLFVPDAGKDESSLRA
ncbi:MAG TPA: substrate-binding domain-containing protein [Chloroflexota bacterium]|nr:substrate-binding domain-containing protein [Chloroflexota bacterium]